MKKLFTILFLFSASVLFGQTEKDVKHIDKKIYTVEYSEFFENPLKVSYTIYKVTPKVDRKGSFYNEPGVKTAKNKDFESNAYDKGHMAAAETFSDTDEHMHLTFSYVNCALQHFKLNRGAWKMLEAKERQWSQDDTLKVDNIVIFDKPYKKLASGAYVPSRFQKVIYFVKAKKKMVFEFPNTEVENNIYEYERKDLEK